MVDERIHPLAASGFAAAGSAYESGRPGYPPSLLDQVKQVAGIGPTTRILDLAAGTGKLTQLLVASGADITAVEPLEDMRKSFSAVLPEVEVLDGTAEAIPVQDKSFRAVTVAQAFHWFDQETALKEIHRVLEVEGWLFLIWNTRDESYPWIRKISQIVDPLHSSVPDYSTQPWQDAVRKSRLFRELQHASFPNLHEVNRKTVEMRFTSSSYIANLPEAQRRSVLEQIMRVIDTDPDTASKGSFWMPYITDVYWAQAI